jgi:phospholipid/cholesterol/gamma-HCH transport system ATP-binding protein
MSSDTGSAVVFSSVTTGRYLQNVSFRAAEGGVTAVVTGSRTLDELLVRLMLGLVAPETGTVQIFGHDISTMKPRDMAVTRRRIGVVSPVGGLVSNLKVWENVVLPLEYHTNLAPEEIEARGREALRLIGYGGNLMGLPGLLSPFERRQVGCARAMALAADLMVYDNLFEGLLPAEQKQLRDAVLSFQKSVPGRTALFVSSVPNQLEGLHPDDMVTLTDGACP